MVSARSARIGTEARGRTREHAEARVEMIGEPRGRRRQWQRDDLTVSAVPNWEKLHSKSLLKCAECEMPPASDARLFTTSPSGPYSSVKIRESSVTFTVTLRILRVRRARACQ